MNRRSILIIAFAVVWTIASWQWYTCSIKGMCAIAPHPIGCPLYLNSFIEQGGRNDPKEVFKLERFLNVHENANIAENGVYGIGDVTAVEAFQSKYREEILTPWGYTEPTGKVFTTTRNTINRIVCAEKKLITTNYQPMFTEPINKAYDLSDATLEILLMLFGAFVLGWLFRHIFGNLTAPATTTSSVASVPALAPSMTPVVIHSPFRPDDLKIVEGIGPKIETLFKAHGVKNWSDLANTTPDQLREILARGGERFALANPETWPDQAALARDGRFDDLKKFQDVLMAGRTA